MPRSNDLFKLVNRSSGRISNPQDWLGKDKDFVAIEPEIAVEYVGRALGKIGIEVRVRLIFVDQGQQFLAFGHSTHEIVIANLEQQRIRLNRWAIIGTGKRCLPDLQGMVFLWRVSCTHRDHNAIVTKRLTMTDQRRIHFLTDQVVAKLQVGS